MTLLYFNLIVKHLEIKFISYKKVTPPFYFNLIPKHAEKEIYWCRDMSVCLRVNLRRCDDRRETFTTAFMVSI